MNYTFQASIIISLPFFNYIAIDYHLGICIENDSGVFHSHAMLIMCTADLPAKAKVANHVQYNGYYGCITCTIMGTRIGYTHCYPYDETSCSLRTSDTLFEDSKEAALTTTKVIHYTQYFVHHFICVN